MEPGEVRHGAGGGSQGDISRPVAASYGMVIDHYVREGMMGEARRLLSRMQWDKVAPSIDIFNMLLKGYLRGGKRGGGAGRLSRARRQRHVGHGIARDQARRRELHVAAGSLGQPGRRRGAQREGSGEDDEGRASPRTSAPSAPSSKRTPARAIRPRAERVLERMREFECPEKPKPGAPAKHDRPQGCAQEDEARRGALLHRRLRLRRRRRPRQRQARGDGDVRGAQIVESGAQRAHVRPSRVGLRGDGRRRGHHAVGADDDRPGTVAAHGGARGASPRARVP